MRRLILLWIKTTLFIKNTSESVECRLQNRKERRRMFIRNLFSTSKSLHFLFSKHTQKALLDKQQRTNNTWTTPSGKTKWNIFVVKALVLHFEHIKVLFFRLDESFFQLQQSFSFAKSRLFFSFNNQNFVCRERE